jgi:hypothetical protein
MRVRRRGPTGAALQLLWIVSYMTNIGFWQNVICECDYFRSSELNNTPTFLGAYQKLLRVE